MNCNTTSSIMDQLLDKLLFQTITFLPSMNMNLTLPPMFYKLSSLVLPSAPLSTAKVTIEPTIAGSLLSPTTSSLHPFLPSSALLFSKPIIIFLQKHTTTKTSYSSRPIIYELEPVIAALAIFFCRFVIITGSLTSSPDEHTSVFGNNRLEFTLRLAMAILLGSMAYWRMEYDLICSVHLWSHVLPTVMGCFVKFMGGKCNNKNNNERGRKKKSRSRKSSSNNNNNRKNDMSLQPTSWAVSIGLSIIFLTTLPICLYICRRLSNPQFLTHTIIQYTPQPITNAFHYMFPLKELSASYEIVMSFVSNEKLLHDMLAHLLFVSFHIQMGRGHIGIAFLTSGQRRKNMLIRMDIEEDPPLDKKKRKRRQKQKQKEQNNNGVGNDGTEGKSDGNATKMEKSDPSVKFRRSAPAFILFTVLPYMFQVILFGNMNKFAFINVQNQIHRSVRIQELFDHDSHLTAIANEGATSPDVYASSMDTVVATAYDILNRKLFSMAKLLILPGVISRQPLLLVKIFPFIFLSDMLKGRIVASVTDKVEQFQREARDVNSIRQKVEQFDMKNAELLRRSGIGATKFTQRRWDELTLEYQAKMAAGDLLHRTRGFFLWLQRNFVFIALIDCALAKLLAEGSIVVSEIFVFTRAIEDVVDLLLIRSRSESELATLMTQVEKLKVLDEVWSKSKEARLLPCRYGSKGGDSDGAQHTGGIILNNLQYSRGTASVSMEHLVIEPGIYAVTGANGSGKSTLFRLLMACDTNERPIELHDRIQLVNPLHQWDLSDNLILPKDSCKLADEGCEVIKKVDVKEDIRESSKETPMANVNDAESKEAPVTSITLPSPDIVEISQTFYWPLYSKPIDWIYQKHITSDLNETERKEYVQRVVEELQSLSFAQSQKGAKTIGTNSGDTTKVEEVEERKDSVIERLMAELQEEKEDWFSELSGGQKSKVELVRKVFLRNECPSVLLVDETMAPLDPASKSQVMSKLKAFCQESVVLVIYHTDVGRGPASAAATSEEEECVPSNSFFDHNLHVKDKHLMTRPIC